MSVRSLRDVRGTPAAGALLGEIIGLPIRITQAPGISPLPLDGVISDETLRTLLVRPAGRRRDRRIPKSGLEATIVKDGEECRIFGDAITVRPEDRTKLVALAGRRRMR
jgi:RNase P/RNase MRP subunit p29